MCACPISKQNCKSRRCVSLNELLQRIRRAELVGRIFHAMVTPRCLRENDQMLERAEGGIELARVGRLAAVAHVLHKKAERDALGNFQRALHFVHCIMRRMRSGSEMEMGAPLSRPGAELRSVGE